MRAETIREQIVRSLREGADIRLQLIEECIDAVMEATQVIQTSLHRGGKILLFGNGGSAADAQHIAAEFIGRFVCERDPLPAIALTANTSTLTAVGNDYGFDQVFARQVRALGHPGDVAMAISTSGRSSNVLEGIRTARDRDLKTIGLTGGDGGGLVRLVDVPVIVPSMVTARIQECHIALGHVLCEAAEALLFAERNAIFSKQSVTAPPRSTGLDPGQPGGSTRRRNQRAYTQQAGQKG